MDTAEFYPNPSMTSSGGFCTRIAAESTTSEFQLSDYLLLQDCFFGQDDQEMTMADRPLSPGNISSSSTLVQSDDPPPSRPNMVAFRTKSKLDIMDDGFKWRKYGKKMVKNSPNPRNYFKCSSGGCNVKKRVERDREDPRFVITTYAGVHNHESPCVVNYSPTPSTIPNGWNLQDSFCPSPSI